MPKAQHCGLTRPRPRPVPRPVPRRSGAGAALVMVVVALCACSSAVQASPALAPSASSPARPVPTAPHLGPPPPATPLHPGATMVRSRLTGAGAGFGPVWQVPVNGVSIAYRQFGTGPDLVMVTGYNATMSLWTVDLLTRLATHFRVTVFDNRGAGYSTDDLSGPITVPLMAADTVGLIKALGLSRPTLLGWSMGGEIGLTVAALFPGVLSRLVTTGADAGGYHTVPSTGEVAQQVNEPSVTIGQTADLIFPPTAGPAKQAFLQQYLLVPQENVSPQALSRQAQAEGSWSAYTGTWDALPSVRIPVLLTNGTDDVVNPPGNAEILRERLPTAEVALFPGAGHGLLFQDPGRFVTLVADFAA